RATIAKEKGLERLADLMLKQETLEGDRLAIASEYVDEEKEVANAEDALAGARDIVAETMSDDADVRKTIRFLSTEKGFFNSVAMDEELAQNGFEMYKEFTEKVKTIPPYRILAINRGEREGALRAWVDVVEDDMVKRIESAYITNPKSIFVEDLEAAAKDAYNRLISPAIQREIRKALTERADQHAIEVFARNLKALLLSQPMKDKIIMGIDPGFRSGSKVAVIDSTGKYLKGTTIYPHPPQKKWDEAKSVIKEYVDEFGVHVIAIGNGTASRETEQLVAETIKELNRDIFYTIVNEAGASVYSASPVAKQEFPELDASMRGNISIARRLMDPLSELVKIDPKSIGVGLYQHDVDQIQLSDSLDQVVESCVNVVGVDLNTASVSLLKYVAGINNRVAENIVKLREEKGRFSHRTDLKDVKGLGDNSFVQSAGFLRIPESDTFFDTTAVHPESYDAAQKLLDHFKLSVSDVKANGSLLKLKNKESKTPMDQLAEICGCGTETLVDIMDSLEKPNRDPRDGMPEAVLRSDVLSMKDLHEGMILKGTVRNVVDFGAFVDIGVKQDGLVHLSQMAKKFVKNPLDIVKVGDIVEVKITKVDADRGRIGLSMILD
ncbi:RNA-binding transcriptional accessory protein, partial [candidate division KSB1 bacterium]|nr:RNA-binding transcriptional accessory protein [candidate division KSB1 bacterium]